jgi:hypothetical protein
MSIALISLLMPTRARQALVKRFFQSVLDSTAHADSVEVILYIDDDDTESHGLDCEGLKVRRIIGPRVTMGEYNSRCLVEAKGEIIVLVNDDMVVRTYGWDERLRELDAEYEDKVYLAYGNDLFKGKKLCTFPILSRRTCELLIDPFPAQYRGAFIDYHLLDIFKRLDVLGEKRIRYLEDVVFEHLHYRTGKAQIDETYTQRKRFADDLDFLALSGSRLLAAQRVYSGVHSLALPEFKEVRSNVDSLPKSLLGMFIFITRSIFFDRSLPLRWRSFLSFWFFGRQLASRGLLWPLVR